MKNKNKKTTFKDKVIQFWEDIVLEDVAVILEEVVVPLFSVSVAAFCLLFIVSQSYFYVKKNKEIKVCVNSVLKEDPYIPVDNIKILCKDAYENAPKNDIGVFSKMKITYKDTISFGRKITNKI